MVRAWRVLASPLAADACVLSARLPAPLLPPSCRSWSLEEETTHGYSRWTQPRLPRVSMRALAELRGRLSTSSTFLAMEVPSLADAVRRMLAPAEAAGALEDGGVEAALPAMEAHKHERRARAAGRSVTHGTPSKSHQDAGRAASAKEGADAGAEVGNGDHEASSGAGGTDAGESRVVAAVRPAGAPQPHSQTVHNLLAPGPEGGEAVKVLVAGVPWVKPQSSDDSEATGEVAALAQLRLPLEPGTAANSPTRWVFVLFYHDSGPSGCPDDEDPSTYHAKRAEAARAASRVAKAVGALFTDDVFTTLVGTARSPAEFLHGVDASVSSLRVAPRVHLPAVPSAAQGSGDGGPVDAFPIEDLTPLLEESYRLRLCARQRIVRKAYMLGVLQEDDDGELVQAQDTARQKATAAAKAASLLGSAAFSFDDSIDSSVDGSVETDLVLGGSPRQTPVIAEGKIAVLLPDGCGEAHCDSTLVDLGGETESKATPLGAAIAAIPQQGDVLSGVALAEDLDARQLGEDNSTFVDWMIGRRWADAGPEGHLLRAKIAAGRGEYYRLFIEMDEMMSPWDRERGGPMLGVWRETARWKWNLQEQLVVTPALAAGATDDARWDVPHLPVVDARAMLRLSELIGPENVVIDAEGTVTEVATGIADYLISHGVATELQRSQMVATIESHQGHVASRPKLAMTESADAIEAPDDASLLVPDASEEAMQFLVAHVPFVDVGKPVVAFVRLKRASDLSLEGHAKCRFSFIVFGHQTEADKTRALGEAAAALMLDDRFAAELRHIETAEDFASALHRCLDADMTIVPPLHITRSRMIGHGVSIRPSQSRRMTLSRSHSVSFLLSRANAQRKALSGGRLAGDVPTINRVHSADEALPDVLRRQGKVHSHHRFRDKERMSTLGSGFSWLGLAAFFHKYNILLILGVVIALIGANTDLHAYEAIWRAELFGIPHLDLHFLSNDIIMCIQFGLAAKEITESFLPGGSLVPVKKALSPLLATLGGVVGPIAFFFAIETLYFEGGDFFDSSVSRADVYNGWGVPTATDIVLAWMVATLVFGATHPAVNYLLLLAVVDDAIGLVIIAVAYPDPEATGTSPLWLLLIPVATLIAYGLRRMEVQFWPAYIILAGPFSWYALYAAGVHPALSLVAVVPCMPTQVKGKEAVSDINGMRVPQERVEHLHDTSSAMLKFGHQCDLFMAVGLGLFAAVNSAVPLAEMGAVTSGVTLALVLGKTVGISFAALASAACGLAPLPDGMRPRDAVMVGFIASMGLTVALFIASVAFPDGSSLQSEAKMGALLSSLVAPIALAVGHFLQFKEPMPDSTSEANQSMTSLDLDVLVVGSADDPAMYHVETAAEFEARAYRMVAEDLQARAEVGIEEDYALGLSLLVRRELARRRLVRHVDDEMV